MSDHALCRLDDIGDGKSAGFEVVTDTGPLALLAVRQRSRVFVYVNLCPHWGSPLDFTPGRFLDASRTHIQCATHGALFRIHDGRCIKGPCLGAALPPIPCRVEDGWVVAQA